MPNTEYQPTAQQLMAEVLRLQDQVAESRGEAISAAVVTAAVKQGITDAVSDPKFWSSVMSAIQQQAANEAGGWLFGGLKAAMSKAFWLVIIGFGIYLVGGWSALVAAFKAVSAP